MLQRPRPTVAGESMPLLLRTLLWCYPREFRTAYARDLTNFIALQRHEPRYRRLGIVRFWMDVVGDAMMSGLRMRWRSLYGRRRPPHGPRRLRGRSIDVAGLLHDIRIAARSLLRSPTYTAVAVVTLALGIGATTAIFSVVHSVILRPLPYSHADELVAVWRTGENVIRGALSYPDFEDWRVQNTSFEELGGYLEHSGVFEWDEGATELEGVRMSAGMFPVLGIRPALGRWFTEEEDRIGGPRAVMLHNGLWQRRFGGDSSVVGSTVRINDEVHTIVGVMPAGFFFLTPDIEYSVPLREDEVLKDLGVPITTRWIAYIEVLGRLKRNTDVVGAERELAAIGHRFEERSVDDFGAGIESMHENVVGGVRFMLLVFLGAVGLVLAIACANVANLALTRATSRQREIALRSALGAGRWRLARHALTESILVAVMGGAAGLGVAFIGVRTFLALAGNAIPRSYEVTVSGSTLLLAAAVSVASGVAFGLLPVLQHRHDRAISALRDGAGRGGTSGGRRGQAVRQGLVVAQVGIAVVLLTGAGLLVNSFLRLTSVDPGFEPDNVLTASVNLPSSRYTTDDLVLGFFDDLVVRVRGLPGVTRVSTSYSLPFAESNFRQTFMVEGQELTEQEMPWAGTVIVGDGYFQASAVPILRGRGFTRQDRGGAPHVAVVNETMATRHWPGQDPVGKRFRIGRSISGAAASLDRRFFPDDWITVVGVVVAVRRRELQDEAVAEMYRPHAQMAWSGMSLLVRTAREPEALAAAVQREVWAIDPGLAVTNISTMRQLMDRSIATPRLRTTLLTGSAFVAAFLAMIGVYGVMALSVAQRRQEIGIRMALGASKPTVVAEVLWKGLRVTVIGIGLGLVVAVAGARVLSAMLFEITAHDPLTFGAVVVSLALVAALACYIPARRASRVDPLIALREE